ncbi:unnamed protein product [Lymnaea stagnalis]|uniref:Uncharacterized protein n=1 Tax=Lymnaea stagnalis TaxID=6523 RepID=A0AAV2HNH9_LYMST
MSLLGAVSPSQKSASDTDTQSEADVKEKDEDRSEKVEDDTEVITEAGNALDSASSIERGDNHLLSPKADIVNSVYYDAQKLTAPSNTPMSRSMTESEGTMTCYDDLYIEEEQGSVINQNREAQSQLSEDTDISIIDKETSLQNNDFQSTKTTKNEYGDNNALHIDEIKELFSDEIKTDDNVIEDTASGSDVMEKSTSPKTDVSSEQSVSFDKNEQREDLFQSAYEETPKKLQSDLYDDQLYMSAVLYTSSKGVISSVDELTTVGETICSSHTNLPDKTDTAETPIDDTLPIVDTSDTAETSGVDDTSPTLDTAETAETSAVDDTLPILDRADTAETSAVDDTLPILDTSDTAETSAVDDTSSTLDTAETAETTAVDDTLHIVDTPGLVETYVVDDALALVGTPDQAETSAIDQTCAFTGEYFEPQAEQTNEQQFRPEMNEGLQDSSYNQTEKPMFTSGADTPEDARNRDHTPDDLYKSALVDTEQRSDLNQSENDFYTTELDRSDISQTEEELFTSAFEEASPTWQHEYQSSYCGSSWNDAHIAQDLNYRTKSASPPKIQVPEVRVQPCDEEEPYDPYSDDVYIQTGDSSQMSSSQWYDDDVTDSKRFQKDEREVTEMDSFEDDFDIIKYPDDVDLENTSTGDGRQIEVALEFKSEKRSETVGTEEITDIDSEQSVLFRLQTLYYVDRHGNRMFSEEFSEKQEIDFTEEALSESSHKEQIDDGFVIVEEADNENETSNTSVFEYVRADDKEVSQLERECLPDQRTNEQMQASFDERLREYSPEQHTNEQMQASFDERLREYSPEQPTNGQIQASFDERLREHSSEQRTNERMQASFDERLTDEVAENIVNEVLASQEQECRFSELRQASQQKHSSGPLIASTVERACEKFTENVQKVSPETESYQHVNENVDLFKESETDQSQPEIISDADSTCQKETNEISESKDRGVLPNESTDETQIVVSKTDIDMSKTSPDDELGLNNLSIEAIDASLSDIGIQQQTKADEDVSVLNQVLDKNEILPEERVQTLMTNDNDFKTEDVEVKSVDQPDEWDSANLVDTNDDSSAVNFKNNDPHYEVEDCPVSPAENIEPEFASMTTSDSDITSPDVHDSNYCLDYFEKSLAEARENSERDRTSKLDDMYSRSDSIPGSTEKGDEREDEDEEMYTDEDDQFADGDDSDSDFETPQYRERLRDEVASAISKEIVLMAEVEVAMEDLTNPKESPMSPLDEQSCYEAFAKYESYSEGREEEAASEETFGASHLCEPNENLNVSPYEQTLSEIPNLSESHENISTVQDVDSKTEIKAKDTAEVHTEPNDRHKRIPSLYERSMSAKLSRAMSDDPSKWGYVFDQDEDLFIDDVIEQFKSEGTREATIPVEESNSTLHQEKDYKLKNDAECGEIEQLKSETASKPSILVEEDLSLLDQDDVSESENDTGDENEMPCEDFVEVGDATTEGALKESEEEGHSHAGLDFPEKADVQHGEDFFHDGEETSEHKLRFSKSKRRRLQRKRLKLAIEASDSADHTSDAHDPNSETDDISATREIAEETAAKHTSSGAVEKRKTKKKKQVEHQVSCSTDSELGHREQDFDFAEAKQTYPSSTAAIGHLSAFSEGETRAKKIQRKKHRGGSSTADEPSSEQSKAQATRPALLNLQDGAQANDSGKSTVKISLPTVQIMADDSNDLRPVEKDKSEHRQGRAHSADKKGAGNEAGHLLTLGGQKPRGRSRSPAPPSLRRITGQPQRRRPRKNIVVVPNPHPF